jgi:pimeloyl-ACP methyl ester carboxylesterase
MPGIVEGWPRRVRGSGPACHPAGLEPQRFALADGASAFPKRLAEGLAVRQGVQVAGLARRGWFPGGETAIQQQLWDGIEALIGDYFATDAWAMVATVAAKTKVGVVRGGRSDRVRDEDVTRLQSMSGVEVHTLAEAGHWVHVDDPEGLRRLFVQAVAEAFVSD